MLVGRRDGLASPAVRTGGWKTDGFTITLVVAIIVAVAWRVGLIGGGDDDPSSAEAESASDDAPDEGSTSTTLGLVSRDYEPGDCVFWEEADGDEEGPDFGRGYQETAVVDCDQPHRVQITEEAELPRSAGAGYPAEDVWDAHFADVCGPAAERFLGRPLDPFGRFAVGGIRPLPDRWEIADNMWCGIELVPGIGDGTFAEDVREADLAHFYAPGDCRPPYDPASPVAFPVVPCTEPHVDEVVGTVDMPDSPTPPTEAERDAAHDRCFELVRTYLGREPAAPWTSWLESFDPTAWASGRRSYHCYLAQPGPDDQPMVIEVPARG